MTWRAGALFLAAFALSAICEAIAQPAIDVAIAPAWNGWSRAGRSTEIELRLRSHAPIRTQLTLAAGNDTVRTTIDLEPGRAVRLHVPIASAENITVTVGPEHAPIVRSEARIAQSELPLLGVASANANAVALDGFHAIALGPDTLPRNASAYSSIAALILDAPTLAALDERQLAALLAYTGACGRAVLIGVEAGPRRLIEDAAGCAGAFVMSVKSLPHAADRLHASLTLPAAEAVSLTALGELGRPDRAVWNRIAVLVAAYFGAAVLAIVFSSSLRVWVGLPVVATVLAWAALRLMQPAPQLLVWGEAESGARVARYEAWQQLVASARADARVPVFSRLGAVSACDATQPMRFEFDANRGVLSAAEFDVRLFQRVALCYSGNWSVLREIAADAREDGALDVRNGGTQAWPPGMLVAHRLVYELASLAPGARVTIASAAGKPPASASARAAASRAPMSGAAALWPIELGALDDRTTSEAWLLVSIP